MTVQGLSNKLKLDFRLRGNDGQLKRQKRCGGKALQDA